MKTGLAFFAGILGGAVMTALMIVARIMGLTEMNLAMMLGSTITGEVSGAAWALGFGMHLLISGLIALIYATAFEAMRRSTWWLGLVGGAIHAVIGGFVMLFYPAIHPIIPDVIVAPGAFGINYGTTTAVAFIVLHLMYGAIVGGVYETAHAPVPLAPARPVPEEDVIGAGAERRRY